MKKILLCLCSLFCFSYAFADTVNLHFINEDNTTYQNSSCTIGDELKVPETHPTKYGYDFVGWRPKAARELEYVRFQNKKELTHINTGIMFDSNEIEYETKLSFASGDYIIAFGTEGTCVATGKTSNSAGTLGVFGRLHAPTFHVGNTQVGLDITQPSVNSYRLYINKTTKDIIATFNEQTFNKILTGTITSDKNILLGGASNYAGCAFAGDIYYFRIKKDGVLVRDFIPVTDPDGVVCFYDRVTKTFFYKQSGPDLIAGPTKE